jgi:hypothetical protein
MGVIHKLKQEVVDFILHEKKSSPGIGCRQLAALASQKFQMTVSKSSVSSVLKDANLSSPVGRRTAGEKRFQIPEQKKKEIFKNFPSPNPPTVDASREIPKVAKIKEVAPSFDKKALEHEPMALLPDSMEGSKKTKQESRDLKDKNEDISKKVYDARRLLKNEAVQPHEDVGWFLIKSAFDDFLSNFKLKEFLGKYFQYKLPADLDDLLCLAYFKRVLENLNIENSTPIKNLEKLIPISAQFDTAARLDSLLSFAFPQTAELEFIILRRQNLQEVRAVKILLEDKTEILMDPQCALFWSGRLRLERPALLPKVVDLVSQNLISNVKPLVLNLAQNLFPLPNCFLDMLDSLQGVKSKKISKVSLINNSNHSLLIFDKVPHFPRRYLIGLSPSQKETLDTGIAEKWAKKEIFYHEPTDQVFYFTDLKIDKLTSRVITLFEEETKKEKFSILADLNNKPADVLLNQFFDYWPDLYHASSFMLSDRLSSNISTEDFKTTGIGLSKDVLLEKILSQFFDDAFNHLLKYFIPNAVTDHREILINYLNLKGIYVSNPMGEMVQITADSYFPFWDELVFTLQRINECKHNVQKNKQIYFKIKQ